MIVDQKIVGSVVEGSSGVITLFKVTDSGGLTGFSLFRTDPFGEELWQQTYLYGGTNASEYNTTPTQIYMVEGSGFFYVVTKGGIIRFNTSDGAIDSSRFWANEAANLTFVNISGLVSGVLYLTGYHTTGGFAFVVKLVANLSAVTFERKLTVSGSSNFSIENPVLSFVPGTTHFVLINHNSNESVAIMKTVDDFTSVSVARAVVEGDGSIPNRVFGFDYDTTDDNLYMNINGKGILCVDSSVGSVFSLTLRKIGSSTLYGNGINSMVVDKTTNYVNWVGSQLDTEFGDTTGKRKIVVNVFNPSVPSLISAFAFGDTSSDYDIFSTTPASTDVSKIIENRLTFGVENLTIANPNSYYFSVDQSPATIVGGVGDFTFQNISSEIEVVSFSSNATTAITVNIDATPFLPVAALTPFVSSPTTDIAYNNYDLPE